MVVSAAKTRKRLPLNRNAPQSREVVLRFPGAVVAIPQEGGLHLAA